MALIFPADLPERYYFDLKFKTYSRPSPYTGKVNLSAPALFAAQSGGNIRLPVPANIVDTQRLAWQQAENIGGIAEAVADGITGQMDEFLGGIVSQLGYVGSQFSSMLKNGVQRGVLLNTGDIAAYALQRAGLAMNPVLTQMFKHPEFKEHSFSWRFAPERPQESAILQLIINTIKEQSLPDVASGGAFFSYPAIAMIQIYTGNNGSLYNFQPSVITSVSANYAPMGVPSFFSGTNAPTMVDLSINFLEIILNTRSNMNHENVSGFDFSLGGIGNDRLKQQAINSVRSLL
jgi:hypothetical protein